MAAILSQIYTKYLFLKINDGIPITYFVIIKWYVLKILSL